MRLYLASVEGTFGAAVKVGDQVQAQQMLGIDMDHKSAVLSPAAGVVRAILCDAGKGTLMIQILNREEPAVSPSSWRGRRA
jgi:Na+-translocating ferredoxin:NAD+ oxidoreductase RnfC subunit